MSIQVVDYLKQLANMARWKQDETSGSLSN